MLNETAERRVWGFYGAAPIAVVEYAKWGTVVKHASMGALAKIQRDGALSGERKWPESCKSLNVTRREEIGTDSIGFGRADFGQCRICTAVFDQWRDGCARRVVVRLQRMRLLRRDAPAPPHLKSTKVPRFDQLGVVLRGLLGRDRKIPEICEDFDDGAALPGQIEMVLAPV